MPKRLRVALLYAPNGALEGVRLADVCDELHATNLGRQGQVQEAIYRARYELVVETPSVEVRRWDRGRWQNVKEATDGE